jgi:Flp pilus assembly protein TadG
MKKLHRNEEGVAIVEATILLPFCMIMVIALYYAAIFMCQKANLQANLQNTLIYYKNTYSDSYVTVDDELSYTTNENTIAGVGSGYSEPTYLFPYRLLFMKSVDRDAFGKFFRKMSGYMFFDDGSNVDVTVKKTNYVIYKSITATATQEVSPAISFDMIGIDNTLTIKASGTVVISDGDEFIRDVDFAIDILEDTKLGDIAKDAVGKVNEFYNDFKTKFNIN